MRYPGAGRANGPLGSRRHDEEIVGGVIAHSRQFGQLHAGQTQGNERDNHEHTHSHFSSAYLNETRKQCRRVTVVRLKKSKQSCPQLSMADNHSPHTLFPGHTIVLVPRLLSFFPSDFAATPKKSFTFSFFEAS